MQIHWPVFVESAILLALTEIALLVYRSFDIGEPAALLWRGRRQPCRLLDMSVSGARLRLDPSLAMQLRDADVIVEIAGVGPATAHVTSAGSDLVHLRFGAGSPRQAIITKLYTGDCDSVARRAEIRSALGSILKRAFGLS